MKARASKPRGVSSNLDGRYSDPQGSKTRLGACCTLALSAFLAALPAAAQDKKKPDKKPDPQVIVAVPLGAAAGKTTRITLRGFGLDKATQVKLTGGTAKIVRPGAAPVPDKNPQKIGDTQVVLDVTLDEKPAASTISLVVVTPDGELKPHKLLVETALPVIADKEPNDGFKQSQAITLPVVIEGMIDRPKDVDVFRFAGKKGQKFSAEVLAHRYGSPLDAMLTLYSADGNQVAFNDDLGPDTRDARLEVVLPVDGEYYLVLVDALDTGGPAHAYRLVVK